MTHGRSCSLLLYQHSDAQLACDGTPQRHQETEHSEESRDKRGLPLFHGFDAFG